MAIVSYLQELGATHLFTLDNVGTSTLDDLGNSGLPTNISGGAYSFQANPVCYGASHSVRTTANTNASTDGAVFTSTADINASNSLPYNNGTRTLFLWTKQDAIQNVTCIYEQGGGTNNFAFMGGAQTTFQAADAGQPFLITATKDKAIANRAYFFVGVWEYHTQHSGSGNRVILYANGVLQEIAEENGTDVFPSHNADITLGNSSEALRSFAETVTVSQTTAKNINYLGMYNNTSLTEAQCRNIFERMVIPEVVISTDTVANQQAALNALSGTTYQNVNCAIEIRQATDATDYTLALNNITFVQNPNLKDIAVQYVGPNTLTLINANSNAVEVSTPAEKDLDGGTTVLTGGGTINIVPLNSVSITGLIAGSTLRVYNTTTSTQVVNQVVAGTSYNATYAEGVGYSVGDVLELRVAKTDKLEFTTSVIVTSAGWSALVSQDSNPTYVAYGKDGSTVTGISWDSGNMEFDFDDADNQLDGADIGAWYQYFITTSTGIAEAFGALIWPQINRITNVTSKTAITFDNAKSAPLRINNCWIDRDDGASIIAAGSNSIQINPPAVFVQGLPNIENNTNLIPALL